MQTASRKDQALSSIGRMLDELESLELSHAEIRHLVHLLIMERERRLEDLSLAAIDCNPESLSIYERQLLYVTRQSVCKFLLAELHSMEDPAVRLAEFDIILATATHFEEVRQLLPSLLQRLFRVEVGLSARTEAAIRQLAPDARIGILVQSQRFRTIVEEHLGRLRPDLRIGPVRLGASEEDTLAVLQDTEAVIVPPDLTLMESRLVSGEMSRFRRRGGQVIPFEHQIEGATLQRIDAIISGQLDRHP